MLSAWAVDRSISLGQLATDEKSNEITAIPQRLDNIEIKGAVVTIDAAGCQREIAKKMTFRRCHPRSVCFASSWLFVNSDRVIPRAKTPSRKDVR